MSKIDIRSTICQHAFMIYQLWVLYSALRREKYYKTPFQNGKELASEGISMAEHHFWRFTWWLWASSNFIVIPGL